MTANNFKAGIMTTLIFHDEVRHDQLVECRQLLQRSFRPDHVHVHVGRPAAKRYTSCLNLMRLLKPTPAPPPPPSCHIIPLLPAAKPHTSRYRVSRLWKHSAIGDITRKPKCATTAANLDSSELNGTDCVNLIKTPVSDHFCQWFTLQNLYTMFQD